MPNLQDLHKRTVKAGSSGGKSFSEKLGIKNKKPLRPGQIGEKDKSISKKPIRSKLSHEKHNPAVGSQSKDGKGYKLGE